MAKRQNKKQNGKSTLDQCSAQTQQRAGIQPGLHQYHPRFKNHRYYGCILHRYSDCSFICFELIKTN